MSGSPKFVEPALALAIQLTIEAVRAGQAAGEERRRRQAEQDAVARMNRQHSQQVLQQAEALHAQIAANEGDMEQNRGAILLDRLATLIRSLRQGSDYGHMAQQGMSIEALRNEFVQAMAGAQLSRLSQIHDQNARRRAELTELSRRLDESGQEDSERLDRIGYLKARDALEDGIRAAGDSDSVKADYHLRIARTSVEEHLDRVAEARLQQRSQQESARRELSEARSIAEGLHADEVVVRWTLQGVQQLEAELARIEEEMHQGNFGSVSGIASRARSEEAALVKKANAAQIKADQREYIANSIRQVLENMGFFVSELRDETPGHPASARVFDARNAAGKGISVSVPFEGEVWYDIEGYPKHTASKVGGGSAAVCDEAESVIEEMHELLETEFQVKMGELMWEGKDPDRILRMADELPRSSDQSREDSR